MQLSPHFSLSEMVASQTAAENGIDNTPDAEVIANLSTLAAGLEKVRTLLGDHSMRVTSGYRCSALNAAVRGVPNSAHLSGYAADFVCPDFGTPLQIVHAIVASDIQFDQCIQEGDWVHFSVAPDMRRQVLTAEFHAGGNTTYSEGA